MWSYLLGLFQDAPPREPTVLRCRDCGGWVRWMGEGWSCGVCRRLWWIGPAEDLPDVIG